MDGIENVPLDTILRMAWSRQELTEDAERLVQSVYDSSPEKFLEFFGDELRSDSTFHFEGVANIYRRNRNAKGIWHAIVGHLLDSPETRAQTKVSIERLIESADGDDFVIKPLRSLLP